MNTLLLLAKVVVAYLIGSISGALVLGRFRRVDIRTQGSGNAGGTTAFRTQGAAFAAGVVAIDLGKGAVAALLGDVPLGATGPSPLAQALCCGFACALGHVWPVFFGFRGGKGAATLAGALLVVAPGAAAIPVLVWLGTLATTGVNIGTLVLGGGGNQNGAVNVSPATTLHFADGTHVLSNTATVIGGGSVNFGRTADR